MTRIFIKPASTRGFFSRLATVASVAALAALTLPSCSSDSDSPGGSDRGRTRDTASSDTAIAYALMIRSPDGFTDYIMAGNEVPTGVIDTSRGIELPGGNYYFDDTAIYYSHFEKKSLQRYVVNDKLEVELAGEFSLANYTGCTPVFFSKTKAYCIDVDDGLLIKFDPSIMEITGEIEAPALPREGFSGWISQAERVGDRYLASVVYSDSEFTKTAEDSTIAITIQDDAEEPLTVLRDDRAASVGSSFTDNDGNFYAIADGAAGYFSLVQGQTIHPRLLRVNRGSSEIDPDYLLDLGELLDTPAVNGLWPLKDTKFVLQAWRGKDPGAETLSADDLDVKPNWEWYIVDAESRETKKISALGRSTTSYTLLRFVVDEQLYLQQYVVENEDYNAAHIELYQAEVDGSVKKIVESKRGDLRMMTRLEITD